MVVRAIVRKVHLFFHSCSGDNVEYKHIQFMNPDPNANPIPRSIYGPEGSYWLELYHCKVCDRYSGKRYDTYGGQIVSNWEAKRQWLKDEQGKAVIA